MNERERINALDLTLNNELNEHKFYMKNAERTTNPLGKAMFRQIGNEELEHYERLKQLHEEWTKRGKWPNTLPLKVRDTEIKNVLSEFVSKAETSAPSESDEYKLRPESSIY